MSHKRKTPSDSTTLLKRRRSSPPDLLDNNSSSTPYAIHSSVDPTYGQRGAFPGLDSPTSEEELFYGPANDGLQYLRMVRLEARGVPNLLVAPSKDEISGNRGREGQYEQEVRGYYEDGAYTALPAPGSTVFVGGLDEEMQEEDEDLDPQEAYYISLMDRFQALRSILHSPPPESARLIPKYQTGRGMASAATRANDLHGTTHSQWRFELTQNEPPMQVLACMGQEGVIRGLSRLETMLSKSNLHSHVSGKVLGAWCWGLLGRCKDLGEMSSEEVAVVRMVGKTALRLGQKLRMQKKMGQEGLVDTEEAQMEDVEEENLEEKVEPEALVVEVEISTNVNSTQVNNTGAGHRIQGEQMEDGELDEKPVNGTGTGKREQDEEMEDGELDEPEEAAELLAKAKQTLLARVRSTSPCPSPDVHYEVDIEARTFATLDMIVTVVGEFYGQRDLLDARDVWS
ncbi:hypothetical protein MMC30_005895 [Trapelia coarctata]|nr:hypothetical protein [Trapelia coarctata]